MYREGNKLLLLLLKKKQKKQKKTCLQTAREGNVFTVVCLSMCEGRSYVTLLLKDNQVLLPY